MIDTLKNRFEEHMERHPGLDWGSVEERLRSDVAAMSALQRMEDTGGEPDAVCLGEGGLVFCDCSAESPAGRRGLCYDDVALRARAKNPPGGSAAGQAADMGVELLTEQQYRKLQEFGDFDLKTSSWIATPDAIRQCGGALFCEQRYGAIFTFHNGADSYYASRGWRGLLRV